MRRRRKSTAKSSDTSKSEIPNASERHAKNVLIRRKDGLWALPGGFLAAGETFQACALREFKEEAGIDLVAADLVQSIERPVAFDALDRDPRSRIISGAVVIRIWPAGDRPKLVASDDAADARWFDRRQLPRLYADHNEIVGALVGDDG